MDSQQPLKTLNQQYHAPQIKVDATANILAYIDQQGYQDAILRDADRILGSYLMPMDFPWMHGEQPVMKNMAFDIDEMPNILTIDDGMNTPFEKGTFGYGKFETGKNPKGGSPISKPNDDIRRAARRSRDPGIIELTTIKSSCDSDNASQHHRQRYLTAGSALPTLDVVRLPSSLFDSGGLSHPSTNGTMDDSIILDDASLQLRQYRYTQAEQMRKIAIAECKTAKKFISVRFGCVSSRKTIFEPFLKPDVSVDSEELNAIGKYCRHPILVNAFLPLEIVNGRHFNTGEAKTIADSLGSYDIRNSSASSHKEDQTGKEDRKRICTGRTRILWTKEHAKDKRNRIVTSILSGSILEPGTFKRSRDVRVAIKLNGEVLSNDIWETSRSPKSVVDRALTPPDTLVTVDAGILERTINAAITGVAGALGGRSKRPMSNAPICVPNKKVCLLDCSGFIRRLIRNRNNTPDELQGLLSIQHEGRSFLSPRFECLPTADGTIRLTCISFGTLAPCWIPSVIQAYPPSCTICNFENNEEKVEVCKTCGVAVHLQCYRKQGECYLTGESERDSWHCASCSNSQKERQRTSASDNLVVTVVNTRRRSIKVPARFRNDVKEQTEDVTDEPLQNSRRQCAMCPHTGGAMNADGNDWVHDVCRVWSSSKRNTSTRCVYCGETSSVGVTKCAGNRCSIYFHPMCAILVSKMATKSVHPPEKVLSMDLPNRKQQDIYLSTQATLKFMHCNLGKSSTVIPVAFCGYHNPLREPTFYGCYPAGQWIGESVRIPPSRIKV